MPLYDPAKDKLLTRWDNGESFEVWLMSYGGAVPKFQLKRYYIRRTKTKQRKVYQYVGRLTIEEVEFLIECLKNAEEFIKDYLVCDN